VVALLVPALAQGATITVTTEDDLLAAAGPCSLREAIQAANTDAVSGGCAAGSGADTINLPAGAFGLTRTGAGENANSTGDLDITAGDVTINGAGAGVTTIDARGIDRVLNVLAGATTTLTNLTVTGGRAPDGVNGSDGSNGSNGGPGVAGGSSVGGVGGSGESGGGILSAGTLSIDAVVITRNKAGDGGDGGDALDGGVGGANGAGNGGAGGASIAGIGASGGAGGGISATGPLTITNSTISDNSSGRGGDSGDSGNGGDGGFSAEQ
jgi:CSLREA domain-containing protein